MTRRPPRRKPDATEASSTQTDTFLAFLKRRFPRIGLAATVVVAAVATLSWAVDGTEKLMTVIRWFEPANRDLPYVEVVFDRSADMDKLLDGEPVTKWVAAKQALQHVDISNKEYIGLRVFGGKCTNDLGRLQLAFTLDGKLRLQQTLEKLQPDGNGNLANAVIAAMDDFLDAARYGHHPRVIVIAGSNDVCSSDQIGAIRDHQLHHPEITLDFRFIGMHLDDAEKEELESIRAATSGKIVFVSSREEISRALDTFLVWEPMENSVRTMLGILNDCITRLNKVVADLNEPGLGTADGDFSAARDECHRSNEPFRDLGEAQGRLGPRFQELYKRIDDNRGMLDRVISVMGKLIASAKSGDLSGYALALKEFTEIEATYNRQIADLNAMLQQLQSLH